MGHRTTELASKIIRKTKIEDSEQQLIVFLHETIFSSSLQENELTPLTLRSHLDRHED
ncbi:hypothetical protein D3C74_455090 [compost metagenome]